MIKRALPVLVMVLFAVGVAYTLLRTGAHEFTDKECADCHATPPVKGNRETLRMTAPIPQLCGRCHGDRTALSHPVEIKPSTATLPGDLPLSWEGKMTCSTCHDIHSEEARRSLRRPVSGAAFCSACHGSGFAAEPGHTASIGRAHLMKYTEDREKSRVDSVSRGCLGCHDGSLGLNDDVQIRSGSWSHGKSLSRYDPQGSHPIGINYRRALLKRGGLRPVERLNPAIKLIDGKVGCPSCHDPFGTEKRKLAVANNRSQLCLECHDK